MALPEIVKTVRGDEYGQVNVRFTVEGLDQFLALLNMNKIRNHLGNRLTFSMDERLPGEAIFLVTEHTE